MQAAARHLFLTWLLCANGRRSMMPPVFNEDDLSRREKAGSECLNALLRCCVSARIPDAAPIRTFHVRTNVASIEQGNVNVSLDRKIRQCLIAVEGCRTHQIKCVLLSPGRHAIAKRRSGAGIKSYPKATQWEGHSVRCSFGS